MAGLNLTGPESPRSVGEIENLFARVQLSHTARSNGPFEFPMKCKLEKLCRVTIQAHNKANIQRSKTNKAYEGHKENKEG